MTKKNKAHPSIYQEKPWANNQNNIWLASTINLFRNVDKFPFPAKLDKDKRSQIISLVSKIVLHSGHLKNPDLIRAEEIGPLEKEYLVEHFLTNWGFHQAHSGEAFILDDSGTFLTTININNHIQFEMIECNGELENAWNRMIKVETELGQAIDYAYSSKFGFLTANPNTCGTGFVLTIFLQPSALIHLGRLNEVLQKIKTEEVALTGLQGDPNQIIGDIHAFTNNYTLGLTEENIISTMRLFTTKLLVEENSARNTLREGNYPEVKDKVSRAFGVLSHSYQIETLEALDAISLLKLGADLGWLKGVTPSDLNHLFFDCRRAHLLSKFEEKMENEEIPHRRAEFIHQTLKKAKLTI